MTVKAFVSSTVVDLSQYRDAVGRALEAAGIEYVTLDNLLPRSMCAGWCNELPKRHDVDILTDE